MNSYKKGNKPSFKGPPRPVTNKVSPELKPSYYHTGNIDVIKFAEENFVPAELKGFYRMNVLKYVTRFDKKNGLEDLRKADFYLQKLIALEMNKNDGKN